MFLLFLLVAILMVPVTARADCDFECPSSDEMALQEALDFTAASGGGIVQLEARTYFICSPLIVGPNTHLRGAGRGATIIRGSMDSYAKIIDDSFVGASIAAVGAKNVTISDLTVDQATCARNSNGISFLPKGLPGESSQLYNGTPVENSVIKGVEILGYPDYHSYMIWNLKGKQIKITGNWVDGGASSSSFQEGIESFGGHDVLISGNTVVNIGYACINLGAAGLTGSELVAVSAVDNRLGGCTVGVHLGTAMAGSDPQSNYHTQIARNIIVGSRQFGIHIEITPGTMASDLMITGNSISDMTGSQIAGIILRSNGGTIGSEAVSTNTVSDNHIQNIRGTNAHGIRLLNYPNARLMDNTVNGTDNSGIFALDSSALEVVGNRVEAAGSSPIHLGSSVSAGHTKFMVDNNLIRDWPANSAAILVQTGKTGSIRNNVMTRSDSAKPTPIVVTTKSCGVTVTGNISWYFPTWPGLTVAACP
jgi:parallel beta-helix repeat protein